MSISTPSPTATPARRNPLRAIVGIPFGWQVLIGLVLGVILGLVAAQIGPVPGAGEDGGDGPNGLTTTLDTIGSIFVTLLKALVPPLIFLAIVTSIANLPRRHQCRPPGLEDPALVRDHRPDRRLDRHRPRRHHLPRCELRRL